MPDEVKKQLDKLDSLLKVPERGGIKRVPWKEYFVEFITSSLDQYPTMRHFCRTKQIHYGSLARRGGNTFWNQAREAVRTQALAKALEKAPDMLSKKYEKQLRIIDKAETLIEKQLDKLNNPKAQFHPLQKLSLEEKIETLAKAIKTLAETNKSLRGDDVQKHEVKSINLHAQILEDIKLRDKQFNVPD